MRTDYYPNGLEEVAERQAELIRQALGDELDLMLGKAVECGVESWEEWREWVRKGRWMTRV